MKRIISVFTLLSITILGFAQIPTPAFQLAFSGDELIIDYSKYVKQEGIGTTDYHIKLLDYDGLIKASGEGVYPDDEVYKDPNYIKYKESGKLDKGTHWDFKSKDKAAIFYKWATASDDPGVVAFFTAGALADAGLIKQAIKAYYAILIFKNRSACYAADGSFVWYIAPATIGAIKNLTRKYPDLGIELQDASFEIRGGNDTNLKNDTITINPGRLVHVDKNRAKPDLSKMKVIAERGTGKVHLKEYENGQWQLIVDNKPYTVKAVTYGATKVGEAPHNQTMRNWQLCDDNQNGKIDGAYDAYMDVNKNNKRDKDEPVVGDFQLLKDMGCNSMRIYNGGTTKDKIYVSEKSINKPLLRDMNKTYGIKAIMGDFCGAYRIGLDGLNAEYTDYTNPIHCERLKNIVREYVMDNKDEDYVLMWLLGNENNMPGDVGGVNATGTNASKFPQAYGKFLNDVAKMIHEIDPNHPVAVGNQEVGLCDVYGKYATELDILGLNLYRGKDGFGDVFDNMKKTFDRPIVVTEYGYPAYDGREKKEDEDAQLAYNKGNWEDIEAHLAGDFFTGNCLGGVVFQYLDEWWKDGNYSEFDKHGTGNDTGEWYGILGQGNGKDSPYLREPRKSYYYYKTVWNK